MHSLYIIDHRLGSSVKMIANLHTNLLQKDFYHEKELKEDFVSPLLLQGRVIDSQHRQW